MSARVRIGAVRLKGGASLRIFHNQPGLLTAKRLIKQANEIIENQGEAMAGYALVVWDTRGLASVAVHCNGVGVAPNALPEFTKVAVADFRTRVNSEYDILGRSTEDEPA